MPRLLTSANGVTDLSFTETENLWEAGGGKLSLILDMLSSRGLKTPEWRC